MDFKDLIGKEAIYISSTGKKYKATITNIPENPNHGYSHLPTVSLSFRDLNGKLIRKDRVVPFENNFSRRCYILGEQLC